MRIKDLNKIIIEDYISYKLNKKTNFINIFSFYLFNPCFKTITWMRICKYFSEKKIKLLYFLSRLKYRHLQVKYGIQIDYRLDILGGFNIHHYGGIVKIGKNLNIRNNTTIGNTDKGVPEIGDNVFIGVNSVLIGDIKIGDNCIIGAGSVVTKSFDDNSIIAGNPAKLIRKIK